MIHTYSTDRTSPPPVNPLLPRDHNARVFAHLEQYRIFIDKLYKGRQVNPNIIKVINRVK